MHAENSIRLAGTAMAFTFAAFCYMLTLVLCAALIFFVIWQIIAFDELRTDFKNPIDQSNPTRARERILNIERICNLLRRLVVPEYSIHGLFCLMFMCAGEWVTLGLNIPLLLYHLWRFFHRPQDGSEVMYDPVSVMNADILNYCQKESWCKLGFYLLSFFYYLYSSDHLPEINHQLLDSNLSSYGVCFGQLLSDQRKKRGLNKARRGTTVASLLSLIPRPYPAPPQIRWVEMDDGNVNVKKPKSLPDSTSGEADQNKTSAIEKCSEQTAQALWTFCNSSFSRAAEHFCCSEQQTVLASMKRRFTECLTLNLN
ncbi:hypothetical protein DNTS_022813 [Danionella cerebrum]|uniref:Protein cornichon homolog 2 n=1 Tax=Danionella cerebrum TaxID=2873325 RepID=A0A553RAN9_9TELE|nr:hypothetical protein DNTS_022813 [Danionella translucida]